MNIFSQEPRSQIAFQDGLLLKIISKFKSSTLLFLQFPPQLGTEQALNVTYLRSPQQKTVALRRPFGYWTLSFHGSASLELQNVETFMPKSASVVWRK